MGDHKKEWSPLQKWFMGILAGIITSVTLVICIDWVSRLRNSIRLEMRVEQLESIPFPETFPPNETQKELAVIKFELRDIKEELAELNNELKAHRHHSPSDPANGHHHEWPPVN